MRKIANRTNTSIIPAHQALAIERWYEGAASADIANEIWGKYRVKVADSTIRWWFCEEGTLVDAYNDFAEQQNKLRNQKVRNTFSAHIDKAANTLARVMAGQGGMPQVAAAKEWLDRGMGKVPDKATILTGNIRTVAELMQKEAQELKDAEKNE